MMEMLILLNLCCRLHGSMVFKDLRDRIMMIFDGSGGLMMVYEAMWKGLESSGGLWRGLGTPRSQDFEDVSSRLLDSGGPGTGSAMVVVVIMHGFGPPVQQS